MLQYIVIKMSTTVRISEKDRLRLEALSRAIGGKSLGETFGEVMRFVDQRREEFLREFRIGEGEDPMVAFLKEAKGSYGKTGEKLDEHIYG